MQKINWGIIGCGNVTEIKSGPAFNKVPQSTLLAVMRRDAAKAADYAKRHQVPLYFTDANELIHHPQIDAIYIATPPSSHLLYAKAALAAGKNVYVEKPMALNLNEAEEMVAAAKEYNQKLSVAHYRRAQPKFLHLKKLIEEQVLGKLYRIELKLFRQPLSSEQINSEKFWRLNPAISGGGLFHDLAPHQLDILYFLFGEAKSVKGAIEIIGKGLSVPDRVGATIEWPDDFFFSGEWNFHQTDAVDICKIIGEKGEIHFDFFQQGPIALEVNGHTTSFSFPELEHVQQPLIEKVVQYFLNNTSNPSPGNEGVATMKWIDLIIS